MKSNANGYKREYLDKLGKVAEYWRSDEIILAATGETWPKKIEEMLDEFTKQGSLIAIR